jgi:hypothetical protein
MAVWLGLGGADTPPSSVVAEWLSPDSVSGWLFYVALTFAWFWPIAKRTGVIRRPRPLNKESGEP